MDNKLQVKLIIIEVLTRSLAAKGIILTAALAVTIIHHFEGGRGANLDLGQGYTLKIPGWAPGPPKSRFNILQGDTADDELSAAINNGIDAHTSNLG